MKLVPLGDKVVVRRLDAEKATPGGILLPESAREVPRQGRILSVGDGRRMPDGGRAKHDAHEGDRVIFPQYAGTEIEIDGEPLLILEAEQILAIVT